MRQTRGQDERAPNYGFTPKYSRWVRLDKDQRQEPRSQFVPPILLVGTQLFESSLLPPRTILPITWEQELKQKMNPGALNQDTGILTYKFNH